MGAPIKHTCPDIDSVIKKVKVALVAADKGYRMTDKDSVENDLFYEIDSALSGVEDEMEDLRTANATLREWGEEMEGKYSDWETTAHELEDRVEQLEKENAELLKDIKYLEKNGVQ